MIDYEYPNEVSELMIVVTEHGDGHWHKITFRYNGQSYMQTGTAPSLEKVYSDALDYYYQVIK